MTRPRRQPPRDSREADLFGPPEQPDLFGTPEPARYVPKPEHVRNGLIRVVEQLAAREIWWDLSDWEIKHQREEVIEYYCNLLPDPAEREQWRARHAVEVARIDAASGPSRPVDPDYLTPSQQWLRDYGDASNGV